MDTMNNRPLYSTGHKIGALATTLFSLVVYLLTVAPTVTFWDAGEFMAAAYSMGVPHAPGTPLFVLLGRVLSLLPLGLSTAFKMNLLSVLSGAVASGLLYLLAAYILERTTGDGPLRNVVTYGGAFSAGVIFTGLRTVWLNTTEFEVYGLATATMLLVGWLMVYMGDTNSFQRSRRTLLLVVYIISLSIANHLIVMLAAPGVAVFTLLHDREHRNYWLSVLGLMAGAYLVVNKGLDLGALATSIHNHAVNAEGFFANTFAVLGGLMSVLQSPGSHLASGGSFFTGVLLLALCGWWGWREKSLPFFGAAMGLFVLGFSVHLYLPLRAALDPMINEGDPDTLRSLWAVIGREQYGSSYGILPRQVWTLLTGKAAIANLGDLVENIKFFFMYNLPFYNKYLGWQFGGPWLTAAFLVAAVAGAVRHFFSERKSFWFWLAMFMLTGPILNLYMNFQFGHSQFPEVQLHPSVSHLRLHEPRDRDYFFIVSFVCLAFWAAIGMAAAADKLRKAFAGQGNGKKSVLTAGICTMVFLPSLLPVAFNWQHADRSGNYIPQVFARNVMNSLPPDAILFTNGDNDTFPLWYIQEVEGVRPDVRIVNLSLLNLPWYIRQMRDMEPKVPISLPDGRIDSLRPSRLDSKKMFTHGEMKINFDKGTVLYVKDLAMLDIIRTNNWRKPLYFIISVPGSNRTNLTQHLVLEGFSFRINERKAEQVAATDSNVVFLPYPYDSTGINVQRTWELLTEQYDYTSFFRPGTSGESENRITVKRFSQPAARLEGAMEILGHNDKAIELLELASRFYMEPNRYASNIAFLHARSGRYAEAIAVFDSLAAAMTTDALIQRYYQVASIAATENRDYDNSLEILHSSLALDPSARKTYANIFILLNHLQRREEAIELMQTYLDRFPADTTVAGELDIYREGGQFDMQRTFGTGN
jgi:hypothetical protein